MIIVLNRFPTHLAKTDNKFAPNKMQKLNYQSIYNGSLNRFGRAIVMKNMHNYLAKEFKPYLSSFKKESLTYPIEMHLELHTVYNHGSISMRKNKICWKPVKATYSPTWDLDNFADIWKKGINDVLEQEGFIKNDSVQYIDGGHQKYHRVEHIDDRKLIIRLNEK
jgi:Holliday junction resolvase RusA-like endonuclease